MKQGLWRLLLAGVLLLGAGRLAAEEVGGGLLLDVDGTIGPATSDYVARALERAVEESRTLVVLRMDTPGGLDTSMRAIVKAIIASPVPVVGWVAPGGARAASAGTYILYACHLAVMAPGTNLGAATPVEIGGIPGGADKKPAEEGEPPPADASKSKLVNDAAAYIRGLAHLRGRNAEWAEAAVRKAESLSAEEALEKGVIDLIARDPGALRAALHGRTVHTSAGELRLDTAEVALTPLEPDWRSRLLAVISNPNVAYILMLVGIYGLIYEFANPGALVPGTAGAVSLLLALYAFQVLPVSYAGLALILLGLALMVAEAFMPSFGALGLGGVVAFVFGSLILIDTEAPGFGISVPLILTVAAASALLLVSVVGMAIKARARPVVSGREELIGARAVVLGALEGSGRVRLHGEVWSAQADRPLRDGQVVRVIGLEGLVLRVTADEGEGEVS